MNGHTGSTPPAYTEETLRTLESNEGQINAVFACFGSAVQRAQLIEQGLQRFLVIYNKITSDTMTEEDIEKKTLAGLRREIRKHITINDDSVEKEFSTALAERNFLIHRFFLERNPLLASREGRMQLLAELVDIEANLEHCRVIINAMRIAMCEALGIADEWAQDYS